MRGVGSDYIRSALIRARNREKERERGGRVILVLVVFLERRNEETMGFSCANGAHRPSLPSPD